VLDELAALLVRVGLSQAVADYAGDDLYAPELLTPLAARLAPEDVQLFYQTAIIGRRDLPLAPDPKSGFEMTLLRMLAFRPAATTATLPAALASAAGAAASAAARAESAPAPAAAAPPAGAEASGWAAIIGQLELAGAARQLANHCVYHGRQGNVVSLSLEPRSQTLRTAATEDKLSQALARYFAAPVRIEFQATPVTGIETPAQAQRRASEAELESARRAFEENPDVKGLRERFGATVLPDSVRPVK
jgi:DNA polymerase-3 subunit gamma/tau